MKTSRQPGDNDNRALLADKAFNNHKKQDGEHVSPFDNETVQVGVDGIEVALVQGIDEQNFKRTLSAATRATIGIDIAPRYEVCPILETDDDEFCTREHKWLHSTETTGPVHNITARKRPYHIIDPLEPEQDWEEMMKGGLQTALETQVIVFAVKGVSRTCTHQLVRSRRASFHQQSQRASFMGKAPEFRMPESVWREPMARDYWLQTVRECWRAYNVACEQGVSYQDARFILPEGTTNFIMLEYPVREFLNVYAYRGCSMFQWEIVDVMRKCRAALVADHPWIEPYVKISCEKTKGALDATGPSPTWPHGLKDREDFTEAVAHHCTFQGWEQVDEQCDFPWARESNRSFRSDRHAIKAQNVKET